MSSHDNLLPSASYHDMRSFESLRDLRSRDEKTALKAAAQQFEATFMNMLLKTMREANEALGDDELMGSESVEFYQTMHDEQLAATLSSKGMLGLADLMVKQLSGTVQSRAPKAVGVIENTAVVSDPKAQQQAFIDSVTPHAERAAKKIGVAPAALIAQAALETGWGKSLPHNGNNCFGIKADTRWSGAAITRKTMEVESGVLTPKMASFRAYDDIGQSFDDYATFITSDARYDAVKKADSAHHYFQYLSQAGYATDPLYAEKLRRVMASDALSKAGG